MEIDRSELKARAREAMGLTRPPFWAVTLVYLLMTTGVSTLLDLIPSEAGISAVPFFLTIFMMLYQVVVVFGLNLWSLWTSRRMNPGLGALVQGFSVAGRIIFMELLILSRVFLWCIPLTLGLTLAVSIFSFGGSFVFLLLLGGTYAAVWAIMLQYSLAPYLLADRPDDGASAAVRRSVDLMRGWKWELFKLEFSFLGWILLSAVLSGLTNFFFLWQAGFFQSISTMPPLELQSLYFSTVNTPLALLLSSLLSLPLLLWLTPYQHVTRAGFYDARLTLQQQNSNMPPL